MQPTTQQPESSRAHDRGGPGIADSLDRFLVWLDGLRDRRGFSTTLAIFVGIAVALLWGIGQWSQPSDVESRIPSILEREAPGPSSGDAVESNGNGELSMGSADGVPAGDDAVQEAEGTSITAEPPIVVHVSGAVFEQGLIELPAGSRLADAIIAAGGESELADIHRLNLATPLVDGMHVRVPRRDEAESDRALPLIETAAVDVDPGGGSGSAAGQKVNVNTAGAIELQRLPGVGPAIAGAIVSWRDDNGRFQTIDDLLAVPGIGPAKLATMESQVSL